jgi:hypothetical protein
MTERRERICCSKALESGGNSPGEGEPEGGMAAIVDNQAKLVG